MSRTFVNGEPSRSLRSEGAAPSEFEGAGLEFSCSTMQINSAPLRSTRRFALLETQRALPHNLSTAVAFSAAHTFLMSLSRQLIAPLIGLGPYDYGIMLYRYPMEFSNDLVGYTSIIGLYYFFQRYRLAQAQQLAAAELQTKLAQ